MVRSAAPAEETPDRSTGAMVGCMVGVASYTGVVMSVSEAPAMAAAVAFSLNNMPSGTTTFSLAASFKNVSVILTVSVRSATSWLTSPFAKTSDAASSPVSPKPWLSRSKPTLKDTVTADSSFRAPC